jgi:hypothetical protein
MVRNTFPATFTIFQAQKHPSILVKGESCQMHLKRSQQITRNGEIKRIPGGAHNKSSKGPEKTSIHTSIHNKAARFLFCGHRAVVGGEGRAHRRSERSTKRAFALCFVFGPFWGGRGEDSFAAAMARTRDWRRCRVVNGRRRLERQRFWERRSVNINGYV